MMKKISVFLLCLMLLFAFAACGAAEEPAVEEQPAAEQEVEEEAAVVYPLTLTDMAGREVVIEEPVQNIVSGYYISTSACVALGLADNLVAVEKMVPARSACIRNLAAPQLNDLPSVGSMKEFDLEACIAAEPDLVILPKKLQETADSLAELGIAVLLVNPESQAELEEMITLIAAATETVERGDALLQWYAEAEAELAGLTAGLETPSVVICSPSQYLSIAPKDMYQATVIASAGAVNAAAEVDGSNWVDVSYEQLLALNPQVIVSASEAGYTVEDICNDAQLATVDAVVNGQVYHMPSDFESWDSPVPSGVLGSYWLLMTLHPDVYSADDFAADVTDFYEAFYGFTPDTSVF